jgi:zinc/manganese transport system permease protein
MEAFGFLIIPLIGCVLLVGIHTWFGIHVLERGIIFVDLALAQCIALGMAVSFAFGAEGVAREILWAASAVFGASILSQTKKIGRVVNVEAFIGSLYVIAFAATILTLDRTPHGMDELKGLLSGNILWLTSSDLARTALLYGIVGGVQFIFRTKFLALSRGETNSGIWEFVFFLCFAVVLLSSVQIAGVLQVFSFLVLPALTARMFVSGPRAVLLTGWLLGIVATGFGVAVSYLCDLPTAPMIVASMGALFLSALALKLSRQ